MDDELRQAIVDNIFRIWVQPEIEKRKNLGTLANDSVPNRAQVVMSVGQSPSVRLNDEVRIHYHAAVHPTGPPDPTTGETPVIFDLRFNLPPDEDVNAGWMFVINLWGTWQPYFEFHYNSALAREHAAAAREFIDSARADCNANRFRPLVENLWSAAELMAKSLLLLLPDEEIVAQRNHRDRRKKLEEYVRSVGTHDRFLELLSELESLRKPARYLEAPLAVDSAIAAALLAKADAAAAELDSFLPVRPEGRELGRG